QTHYAQGCRRRGSHPKPPPRSHNPTAATPATHPGQSGAPPQPAQSHSVRPDQTAGGRSPHPTAANPNPATHQTAAAERYSANHSSDPRLIEFKVDTDRGLHIQLGHVAVVVIEVPAQIHLLAGAPELRRHRPVVGDHPRLPG